jgi:hypothetical protein
MENEFGIAGQGDLRRMQAIRVAVVFTDVAISFIPSGRCAELFPAPKPKANRQHCIGTPGERLLP